MTATHLISDYWHGNGPLWRVFWLWGIVGSWLLAGLFAIAAETWGVSWPLLGLAALVMTVYTAWILVSVWRCAPNVEHEHWGVVARVLTVAWTLNVVLVGGFLALDLAARASL